MKYSVLAILLLGVVSATTQTIQCINTSQDPYSNKCGCLTALTNAEVKALPWHVWSGAVASKCQPTTSHSTAFGYCDGDGNSCGTSNTLNNDYWKNDIYRRWDCTKVNCVGATNPPPPSSSSDQTSVQSASTTTSKPKVYCTVDSSKDTKNKCGCLSQATPQQISNMGWKYYTYLLTHCTADKPGFCEGDGECGTSDTLNNYSNHDFYQIHDCKQNDCVNCFDPAHKNDAGCKSAKQSSTADAPVVSINAASTTSTKPTVYCTVDSSKDTKNKCGCLSQATSQQISNMGWKYYTYLLTHCTADKPGFCEGDGECGTSDLLNNYSNHDFYQIHDCTQNNCVNCFDPAHKNDAACQNIAPSSMATAESPSGAPLMLVTAVAAMCVAVVAAVVFVRKQKKSVDRVRLTDDQDV